MPSIIRTAPRAPASLASLLLANLLTIGLAVWEGWDLGVLMWIYWAQSVIIGLFSFLKILNLKEFSTEGLRINRRKVAPTRSTQLQVAFFFLFHYGFFHFVYTFFLVDRGGLGDSDLALVLIPVGAFLVNHLFSYRVNRHEDRKRKPNIGRIMFFPYARIIPLHLTILSSAFLAPGRAGLVFFLLLKTGADLVMHAIEHRLGSEHLKALAGFLQLRLGRS